MLGDKSHTDYAKEHQISEPAVVKHIYLTRSTAKYFRIGENKLRCLISEDKDSEFVLWNGNRPQIKRTKFEKLVDRLDVI